ncbi:MAG: GC-type dockerin domain-anchored protein [Phycisphaerales bacterium]
MHRHLIAIMFALAAAAPVLGQSTNVDVEDKYSWGENIGWMNWRDAGAPPGSQGARVRSSFLSGFIWCENVGWITLGSAPASGVAYANDSGADCGVNRDPSTGNLSGFAWGQNVGWINFSGGAQATPAQPAKALSGRLHGFAWGENIGWINLDVATAGQFVAYQLKCNPADVATLGATVGADGILTVDDIVVYLQVFFAGDVAVADLVGFGGGAAPPDGIVSVDDLVYFLSKFFSPCD